MNSRQRPSLHRPCLHQHFRRDQLALGDAFGESVQAEVDIRFDGLADGLVVEVRHHEPDRTASIPTFGTLPFIGMHLVFCMDVLIAALLHVEARC